MASNKSEWEQFFDDHAPCYMDNVFVKDTVNEVDFLVKELALPPGAAIVDVGCGTGRHAIELASRGYRVTGVDLSAAMLAEARKAAEAAGVEVEWIHADATRFTSERTFDLALGLCEGGMGLLDKADDALEQPLVILRGIAAVLKPGAPVVMTVLNGYAAARRQKPEDVAAGRFDPLNSIEHQPQDIPMPDGVRTVAMPERSFTPPELRLLFREAGLEVVEMWGGTAGRWGRRAIDLDEIEIMVRGRKPAAPTGA